MIHHRTRVSMYILIAGFSITAAIHSAETATGAATIDDAADASEAEVLVRYIPPAGSRPTPRTRVGQGGARGTEAASLPTITLIMPEHVAYTTQQQPVLYWDLSDSTPRSVVVTVTGLDDTEPVVEHTIAGPHQKGMQSFALRELDVQLDTGKTYRCSAQLVEKGASPSAGDPLATAFLERKSVTPPIAATAASDAVGRAQAFAGAGYWLDAWESVQNAGSAQAPSMIEARHDLLLQIGLEELSR